MHALVPNTALRGKAKGINMFHLGGMKNPLQTVKNMKQSSELSCWKKRPIFGRGETFWCISPRDAKTFPACLYSHHRPPWFKKVEKSINTKMSPKQNSVHNKTLVISLYKKAKQCQGLKVQPELKINAMISRYY